MFVRMDQSGENQTATILNSTVHYFKQDGTNPTAHTHRHTRNQAAKHCLTLLWDGLVKHSCTRCSCGTLLQDTHVTRHSCGTISCTGAKHLTGPSCPTGPTGPTSAQRAQWVPNRQRAHGCRWPASTRELQICSACPKNSREGPAFQIFPICVFLLDCAHLQVDQKTKTPAHLVNY